MHKNMLITFKFSQHLSVFPQFQVKQINFDINDSTEFLSSKMSKFLKH